MIERREREERETEREKEKERKKGRRRDIERGQRDREVKGIVRSKG